MLKNIEKPLSKGVERNLQIIVCKILSIQVWFLGVSRHLVHIVDEILGLCPSSNPNYILYIGIFCNIYSIQHTLSTFVSYLITRSSRGILWSSISSSFLRSSSLLGPYNNKNH